MTRLDTYNKTIRKKEVLTKTVFKNYFKAEITTGDGALLLDLDKATFVERYEEWLNLEED